MGSRIHKNSVKNLWGWMAFGLLAVFTITFPFQFGYFYGVGLHSSKQYLFERPFLYGVLMGVPAYALAGYQIIRKGSFEKRHLLALLGLSIPLLYFISSVQAASPYLSRLSIYFYLFLYAFFVLGILLSEQRKILNNFLYFYLTIGSLIVLYSFCFLIGNEYKPDAVVYSESVRLASVFTYPNAYAAFLITLLLVNLHFLTSTKRRVEVLIHSFMLVPIAASLLLTLSRGAMIVLPIIALVTLVMNSFVKQLRMIIYFVIAMLLALTIQTDLLKRGNEFYLKAQQNIASHQVIKTVDMFSGSSLSGWGLVIAVSIIMMGITYLFHWFIFPLMEQKLTQWVRKAASRLLIPGIALIIMVVGFVLLSSGILSSLLPDSIAARIQNINLQTHSVLERFTIYQDAVDVWKVSPIIGAGGGAWEALYDRYQTYPYMSSQTHSYPVQLLVETGIVGLLFVGGLILYILLRYVLQYFKSKESNKDESLLFFLIALSVLVHSTIDFEMSYGFFGALVFLCLGVLAGKQTQPVFQGQSIKFHLWIKRGSGILWFVAAALLLVSVTNMLYSNGKFRESVELAKQNQPFNNVINSIESGLKRVPDHPYLSQRLGLLYLSAYEQTKDTRYANKADSYFNNISESEPNSLWLIRNRYSLAKKLGEMEEGIKVIEQAIFRYPFELSFYEQVITDRFALWQQYSNENQLNQKQEQEEHILSLYNQLKHRVDEVEKLPETIVYARPFVITEKIQAIVEHINKV